MLEDKLLVLKFRAGDKDALCRIYQKYKNYLLTLAKGLLGRQVEAEDIVHDIFVVFARSAGDFRLTGNLKNYLAACVCNLARDKIRARTRQAETPVEIDTTSLNQNNPQDCLIEKEDFTRLRTALRQIPYEQREVVLLHLRAGMHFRQIARLQCVSLSTTCGRYRYGLDKLRSLLNSEVEK
jgi:RNA polymerase sigma-70 factor (ECF subfamily)